MVLYEEYERNWFRRIDDLLKEKLIREGRGYGFFRMVDIAEDLGENVHISDISKALGGIVSCPYCGYEWVPRVDSPNSCPECKRRL